MNLSCLSKNQKTNSIYRGTSWSPHPDLNRGPLPYQGSALPLSYVGKFFNEYAISFNTSFQYGAGDGNRTHISSLEG
jgi:hypothetical protein